MLNEFIGIGRVTAPPELKKTNGGEPCANFTLAINRVNSDNADFIDCSCFNKVAENFCKYVEKGDLLAVVGTLQTNMKNDKKYTGIKVNKLSFLGGNKKADDNDNSYKVDIPIGDEN